MNPNPFSDTIIFLVQPGLTTAIFWALLVASGAVSVYVYRTIPGQRSVEHVGSWGFRLLIGCMWWQQTLWGDYILDSVKYIIPPCGNCHPITQTSRRSRSAPPASPIGWG